MVNKVQVDMGNCTPGSEVRFLVTTTRRRVQSTPSFVVTLDVLSLNLNSNSEQSRCATKKKKQHLNAVYLSFRLVVLLVSFNAYSVKKCEAKFIIKNIRNYHDDW